MRVIYLDGAGSYGPNGADDAAAEAALLSKTLGKPVRVQWSRQEEHGLDPKGPAQLLELRAAVDADGGVAAWETQAWLPIATANLPNIPLLSLEAAGIPQTPGRSTGVIYQNVDPPYTMPNVNAVVHWIPDAPLRTSAIRAPGKVANTFAVESFVVDWASYPILTFPEVPALEFELIQRLDQPPLGVGEAASTPVPAALGNAVFDATGVRLRTVPFRADRVKAALARS